MFDGFEETYVHTGQLTLFVRHAGDPNSPGLLLLHGYPQTSAMWHCIAPDLAKSYHVVCPDLRGYGRSQKPPTTPDHAPYSKRTMGRDFCLLMRHFGHERFYIGAHDRGARVAHRMGLDCPDRIAAMLLLDIAPTREMYANANSEFAEHYWHWYFLIQPAPLPEKLIGNNPDLYWRLRCIGREGNPHPFSVEALKEYLDAFRSPDAIHASCEDYRAARTIDILHDDLDHGNKLDMPVHVIWGLNGVIGRCFDALSLWRQRARQVTGHPVRAGHYIAEEIPVETLAEFHNFFGKFRGNS